MSEKIEVKDTISPAQKNSTIFCEICCTEDVQPEDQSKCMKGHVFCSTCAKRMAELQILQDKANLPCLSSKNCEAEFGYEEAKKFLPKNLYDIWQDLSFKELMKILDINKELCPFCDYTCILTGAYDFGIFMCGNRQCGKWSCRTCRSEDHTPLTCQRKFYLIKIDEFILNKRNFISFL